MILYFDDLAVGMRMETQGRTITEADVVNFAGVSGDYNPLHMDAEFAKTTPFGQRIAHGLLVLSVVTGLRQHLKLMEGAVLAFLEIRSWRFRKPVFIGDTIRARTEITGLRPTSNPERGIVTVAAQVFNQHGDVVQEGELVFMVRRKPAAQAG
ncbi:MAG TPA: MaoC/PaaZ C-terminal domain-containing protein [Limnochordales bacterium]